TDFMPIERAPGPSRIVRIVRAARGRGRMHAACTPRFDYGREAPLIELSSEAAIFRARDGATLCLTCTARLSRVGSGIEAEADLEPGERVVFVLEPLKKRGDHRERNARWAARGLRRTIVYWRRWIGRSTYQGESSTAVRRSALVLKLLQSRRTGAIVAAPTFGLPE